jgi:hypothetical protein
MRLPQLAPIGMHARCNSVVPMIWERRSRRDGPDTEGWDACVVFCGSGPRERRALDGPTQCFLVLCDARFMPLLNCVHAGGTDY